MNLFFAGIKLEIIPFALTQPAAGVGHTKQRMTSAELIELLEYDMP